MHETDEHGNLVIPIDEGPQYFEGPRHNGSVRALASAALDIYQRDQLIEKGYIDQKTGLKNQNAYIEEVTELIEQVKSGDVSILFFDLDKLKKVNDTVSWGAGDKYKVTTAQTVSHEFGARDTDKVFIIGSDEYAVVLDHRFDETDEPVNFEEITSRVQAKVVENVYGIEELENTTGLGVSAGWSTYEDGDTVASMLERAHDMVLEQKDKRYAALGEQDSRLSDSRL